MSDIDHEPDRPAQPSAKSGELLTRIISAVIMAVFAIAAVLAGYWAFALLVIAAGLVVNWEWARLVRGDGHDRLALMQGAALLVLVILTETGRYLEASLVLIAAIVSAFVLEHSRSRFAWSVSGLLYILLPAMALIWLRSDPEYGIAALLFVMAVCWTADSAAYLGGRLIGGPKFAPKISPKKTWAGFFSGLGLSALVGYLTGAFVFERGEGPLTFIAMLLALACILGDLFESFVKRRYGAKDASNLIPGHGGLLDRLDGLLIASLAAALIAMRDPSAPGQGLLLW